MRRFVMIFALVGGVMLTSCSSLFMTSSLGSSDLYRTDNRVAVANRLKAEAEAQRAEAEAREAQWEARQAEAEAERAEAEYYASLAEPNYQTIVANDYESAYARRLYGFNSPSYRMPSSYYDLSYSRAMQYATAYDPALYNIMVSGDQVWVEPKFITSMFGSWGATNVTFGIYASPWTYGWSYRVDPFYYSCWGYPRYSWYDWNWTICYNPWYYDSYYWMHYHNHYYHHYHNHYHPHKPVSPRPPQHRPQRPDHNRPNHGFVSTGSGASSGPIAGNHNGRDNSGTRYTSPTSNKNYGGTTVVTRPTNGRGSVSTGVNTDSKYRGTTTTTVDRGTTTTKGSGTTTPTNVSRGTTTTTTTNSGNSGNGNFRQSTTTTKTTTTTKSTGSSGSTTNRGTTTTTTKVNKGTSTSSSRSTTSTTVRGTSSSSSRSSGTTTTTTSRSTTVGSSSRSVGSSSTTTRSMGSGSTSSSSSSRGGSTSSRR